MQMPWYHEKKDSDPISLTGQEEYDKASDGEDVFYQREYRDSKLPIWKWAGSVYNVVQNAQPNDEISNIVLGWIRSYIDTGVSQTTNGEPGFAYSAFGPTDHTKENLWRKMTEAVLSQSYYTAHQKTSITDAHIFGPGVMEVYQGTQYRTIRVPQQDGSFKDKIVPDYRKPRCGVRAISPFRVTRNPNVSDPAEVGSCTKEELLTWNEFVVKYGRCFDAEGNSKYKNLTMITRGSHVKVTKYQDEDRDVYRIYALSYGNESDNKASEPPEKELGLPIFDRPLKIHDLRDARGEIIRSLGLNIPGMCNLIFLPYFDKLDKDFSSHDIYGMGLPEHMEGLDTFVQTAFNMTIDNFRMGNTTVVGIESRDGTVPDFDANTYYGGEFVNAAVTKATLGEDRTGNFQLMYETIQNLAIPGTGINVNQITGDTSKTAFEFAQRIRANSERAETILKGWENGPLKRMGLLTLSAALSEMTTYDLEQLTGKQAEEAKKNIREGLATMDDYEFKDGKPAARRNRFYISVKGLKEDFSTSKSRNYSYNSTAKTLTKDSSDTENKIPLAPEYVYPDWFIEAGVPFDVTVDSKRMLVNKRIQDNTTLQIMLNAALQGIQVDEEFRKNFDFGKYFTTIMERSDFDVDEFVKSGGDDQIKRMQNMLKMQEEQVQAMRGAQMQPMQPMQPMGQMSQPAEPQMQTSPLTVAAGI
jgi:hypothetical protein